MEPRINYLKVGRGAFEAMLGVENYLHECGLDPKLLALIKLRGSQINGCAYCIDMHWKDLRVAGETEQRLYGLDAWHIIPHVEDNRIHFPVRGPADRPVTHVVKSKLMPFAIDAHPTERPHLR